MLHAVDRFGKPESVAVVGIGGGQALACVRGAGKPSAVYPGEGGAVVPGGGVADGVPLVDIGDAVAALVIHGREQFSVGIGIADGRPVRVGH